MPDMPEPLDLAYVGVGTVKRFVDEARGELGAAITQMIPKDDRIICDHVKKANAILDGLNVLLRETSR